MSFALQVNLNHQLLNLIPFNGACMDVSCYVVFKVMLKGGYLAIHRKQKVDSFNKICNDYISLISYK